MISEFNRHSGGIDIAEIPFTTATDTARLLFQIMSLPGTINRAPLVTTLYLLGFPSTHRNYKHLVWVWRHECRGLVGCRYAAGDRGDAWYPTFEESQLRHPTPAYAMVTRMLAQVTAPTVTLRPSAAACIIPQHLDLLISMTSWNGSPRATKMVSLSAFSIAAPHPQTNWLSISRVSVSKRVLLWCDYPTVPTTIARLIANVSTRAVSASLCLLNHWYKS